MFARAFLWSAVLLLMAATAALDSCIVDDGGNRNLNAYQIMHQSRLLVEQSVSVSVSAINQMIQEGRDINAEGFMAKAGEGILFSRTDQDRWSVAGQNDIVTFSLMLVREPSGDGYDEWTCRNVRCLHDEDEKGYMMMYAEEDIHFEWITRAYSFSVQSSLEQTGTYRVEFFPDREASTCLDWCTLAYSEGDIQWTTSRCGGGVYYE